MFSLSVIRCKQWVDLSEISTSIQISGAELCLSPCSTTLWSEAEDYCQVIDLTCGVEHKEFDYYSGTRL